MPLRVSTVQTGLEQSIRKAVKNVNARGGLNIAINDKQFTRPLGKITGAVSEFNKSLEASNARVLAFGASVGIIQSVQRAFASLITTTISVEKQLTEINVVMGTTNDQLQKFGDGLFKVARNTAQSFSTVATAATELARQGLSMEETLKRTNDALILTRLTGLDAASAVSGLTAALNTFNKAGLDSTKVLSKMAAVDVQFAVSTEDLIDAVSRAGAVARDAGVSFDELLGAVTAAQQQTARGGKVIGNSFKTIFTRVQRSSTIKRLEELGIAVRDIAGNTLPAIKILTNLSQTYETLADTTKAAVAEQVGGVFQINILKAAIKDLADNNSILARATRISAQATDEAIRKNEILNKTLAAVSSQAATSIQEFTNAVGSIAFEDNLQTLITAFNDFFKSSADFLRNGEGLGADAARGFIKGFGNIITGPGLILALGVLGKLLLKTFGFLAGSVKELIGIKSLTQQQRDIQKSIVAVLGENEALQKKILSQEGNRAAQEKTILGILQAQSREQAKIASAASAIGPAVMRAGYNAQFKRTRSGGHIPNYVSSSEAKAERSGARSGGYSAGSVKSMNMPGQGRVVYNTAEKVKNFPGMVQPAIMPPPRSRAGRNYQKAFAKTHGFNPYANGGFVPNFAKRPGYSAESPQNIARALIYGKSTAMNLVGAGGRKVKDTFYSYGPAMATGTEMNAIREKIYKKFIQNKGSDFRDQVNASLRGFGRRVPKAWGNAGTDDLVFGMVQQLNSARVSSRKLDLPFSGGFVPNYMRLNAKDVKSIGSKAKIRSQNYDGTIGMSELDKILTTGLFKSINYTSKAGNELTYTNARHGVHKYKKGAPPPAGYVSYGQMDNATGTRALFIGSAGKGADAYRRLRLQNVRSVVSQGKHLRVDPTMAQLGFIPNFALSNTPFGVPYSTGLAGASPANYADNVIAKYESYKNPAKLNELLKSPAFTLDALKYLDNQGLEKIKQSMLSSGMLGSADWEFVKSGIGKPTTADVSKALKQVPARELFNYLTGQTDRIQGNVGGNFIRLLDHKERSAVAMDMIGRSAVSGVIKNQISSIRKSKNRMNNAQMEALIRDVPRLGYDPNRGITRAKPGDYLRAQQYAPGGLIDQMSAISRGAMQSSSSSLRGAFPALGRKVDIQRIAGYMDEFGVNSGKASRALGIRDARAEQAFKAVFGRRRSSGFIPNFGMRQRSTIKATEMGGYGGAPNQVEFVSSVGGQPFTKSMAIVIPDPRNSTKPGLQVVNTLDANPNLRGQGYGRELYEYMAGYAKKKGYAALYGDAGTSPSAMRVVDSIAKKGSFNVEKNNDLKFFKDDFDTTGMYASDSWTYRMSNKGFVPSYMFRPEGMVMHARHKMSSTQSRQANKLRDFILRRGSLDKQAQPFEPSKMGKLFNAYSGKPIDTVKFGGDYRAAVVTKDGSTYMGRFHDDIRDALAAKGVGLKGAADLELTWFTKNTQFNSSGLVPNYMKMLSLKDLMSKTGGAAKSLISTPFKDAGSLIKGGYKGMMFIEHMLRGGLRGGYKGLQFGEKMLRGSLGMGLDFMKNFPRTTLYGGGGGLAYAFRDMLPMVGGKISGGFNQLIDLIAANPATAGSLLGALGVTGTMGTGMLLEALQAGKLNKIKGGLLGKGKHRANTLVKDLPPDLQKIALGRMKSRAGPNSFVPKSILDELGMASGFIPNYALFSPGAKNVLSTNPQYAGAVASAVSREASFGVTPKVVRAPSLRSRSNPGLAVVNQEQEGGKLSNARRLHGGLNPKQGASGGFVPNYAPIDPKTFARMTDLAMLETSRQGLDTSSDLRNRAQRSLMPTQNPWTTMNADPLLREMREVGKEFGNTAVAAREATVRTKALRGNLVNLADKNFARELFRSEATRKLRSDPVLGGLASSLIGKGGKLDENALRQRMIIAQDQGDKQTLNQLKNLNKIIEKDAQSRLNAPKTLGTTVAKEFNKSLKAEAMRDRFAGTRGFSKSELRRELSGAFLQSRGVPGIEGMTKGETDKALSAFFKSGGSEAQKAFSRFAQETGARSSVSSLAKGGLMSGELRGLTGSRSATGFIGAMNSLEKTLKSGGSTKDIRNAQRLAISEAAKAADPRNVQAFPALAGAVNNLVDEQKRQNREANKNDKQQARLQSSQRLAAQGGRFNLFRSQFQAGRAGQGSGLGGLLGRGASGTSAGLRQFAGGLRGFGGNVGLTASFALPMLAGFVGSRKPREDRASFEGGQFRITEGAAGERASSTLMGAGIGALFGLPGMLIGAAAGFSTSASKMSLSIEEIVKMQEKQIASGNANIQATTNLANLNKERVRAFSTGNLDAVNQIDTAINQAISQITDPEVLGKVLAVSGSPEGLSNIQKTLQGRLSQDVSTQNFALAIDRKNSKNAATSLANLIDQRLRSGEIQGGRDAVNKTLNQIRDNLAKTRAAGTAIGEEELLRIRAAASGKQGLTSSGTLLGTGGGLLAAGGILGLSALAAPFTGGTSLLAGGKAAALTLGIGGTIGGVVGRKVESDRASQLLANLGEDPAKGTDALARLRDASIITQGQFEALSAAFNAGVITFEQLQKQLELSLDAFDKVTKRQTVLGQQTFNLEKSFDKAIRALRKSSEIENIREGGRIKREGSILDFSSRFSANTPQNRLNQSERRLNLFNQGVGFRVRSFEDAQSAQLLTSTKQAGKTLSFTPNLTQGLIDTVRQGGGTALQSQIDSRKLSGELDLFGGLDAKGRKVLLNDLENLFKTNTKESLAELAGIIGTSDKGTIDSVRNLITDRQGILSGENIGTISFQKEISEQSRAILQDILDKQQDRRDILAAQIETDRKNAKLAEAQSIVQGRVNDLLSELSSRNSLQDSRERGFLGRQRASSQRRISGLAFEASDTFRGSRTNKEERTRQTQLQEKIFQEELKTKQQEEVSRLKSEARRLISEQKLVFALNNLSKNIDDTVRKIVDDPSGSTTTVGPGLPGSKSPSGLNGLAAGLSDTEQKKVDSLNDQIKKERDQASTLRRDITRARNNKELAAVGGRLRGINTQRKSSTTPIFGIDGMQIDTATQSETDKELATRLSREISAAIAPKIVNGMSAGMSDSEKAISKTLLTMEGNDLQKVEKLRAIIENAVDTTKQTVEQYDKEIAAKDSKLEQLSASIDEKVKEIQVTRNKISSTTTSTPKVLEKLKDMGNITINTTNDAIKAINELGFDASDLEKLKSRISSLSNQKGITDESRNLLDTLMSEIYNSGEAIQDFIKSQNLKLFQDKFEEFTKSLQFMDESMGTFRGLRELNSLDIRQRAASNTLSNVLEQDNREAQFQTLMQDPSATNAQRAAAKVAARSQKIGTQTQRDELLEFEKQADAARQEVARIGNDKNITDEERNRLTRIQSEKLTTLNRSMVDLTLQMQRTTARDGGVTQEIPTNLGLGLEQGFADLEAESEGIYTRLGRDLPFAFRDGMVDAMQAALNGADNLSDRLKDIGISFLQMIQRAFLQSAANRITGAIGGAFGLTELNSGGMVRGGSGVRDDVPALLTGGEYVIRKSAVQRYGTGMLNRINQGQLPAFAKGGAVDMNIGAPKAAEREAYQDSNKYGTVTRYKTTKGEIGINQRLTGFARANDRKILEYFKDQEDQFRQDLRTKEQEEARAEAKKQAKKAQKNALIGAIAGIAGGVLIGKAMDWYQGTDFAKNRAAKAERKKFDKSFERNGKYDYKKGRASYQQSGVERAGLRRDIDYFQNNQGWNAGEMSQYLRTQDVQHRITGNQSDYKVTFNKGGQVPAMLTGGEYVMKPSTVKNYGSQMMKSINNGSFSAPSSQVSPTNNDVKININVDNQGNVSQTSNQLDSKEFATKVKSAILDVIQKEKRVGGSLR